MNEKRTRRAPFARAALAGLLVVTTASVVVASAFAANVVGTAGRDTLRGSAKADKLIGKAGNDKLFGLAGNDLLNGGPGNDMLVGGPGRDILACGAGKDVATADAQDKFGADCELVKGLPKPGLSMADVLMQEGNAGSQAMSFSVTLAKASPLPVSVSYATADGTATAGSDYTAASGKLVFAPGEKSKKVAVTVLGETVFEPDETFTIGLSNPVNATLARASATGTIKNEDVQKPKPGRYAGTSSQGKSVAFDVNPELTGLTALNFVVDLPCQEVSFVFTNLPINLTGFAPLTADWRFGVSYSESDSEVAVNVTFGGVLAVSGPASGTLRVDLTINTDAGPVHCSSGDVSWTASPPA
jgi:hypothetical protein